MRKALALAALPVLALLAGCTTPSLPAELPVDPDQVLGAVPTDLVNLHLLEVGDGVFALAESGGVLTLLDDTTGTGDLDQELLDRLDLLGVDAVDQVVRLRPDDVVMCRDLFTGVDVTRIVSVDPDAAMATAQACAEEAVSIPETGALGSTLPLGGLDADVLGDAQGAVLHLTHGDVSALVPGSAVCDQADLLGALGTVDVVSLGDLADVSSACAQALDALSPVLSTATDLAQPQGLLGGLLGLVGLQDVPVQDVVGTVLVQSDGVQASLLERTGALPIGAVPDVADSIAPQILDLAVIPPTAGPGDVVQIVATLQDQGGAISEAALALTNGEQKLVSQVRADAVHVIWKTTTVIPMDGAGTWSLAYATVRDHAGHATSITGDDTLLTVLDRADGAVLATLDWTVATHNVARGGIITVAANEDVDLDTVTATLEDPTGAVHDVEARVQKTHDGWLAEVPLPSGAIGAWRATALTATGAGMEATTPLDALVAARPDVAWITDAAIDGSSWLEITNPTDAVASLEGWTLSHAQGAYTFPDVDLPAGDSIRVMAQDGVDNAERLYADIDGFGGVVTLIDQAPVDALAL